MERIEFLLAVIAVLLFVIVVQLSATSKRLLQHFPTDKEQDFQNESILIGEMM